MEEPEDRSWTPRPHRTTRRAPRKRDHQQMLRDSSVQIAEIDAVPRDVSRPRAQKSECSGEQSNTRSTKNQLGFGICGTYSPTGSSGAELNDTTVVRLQSASRSSPKCSCSLSIRTLPSPWSQVCSGALRPLRRAHADHVPRRAIRDRGRHRSNRA